jgi:hypothetical protein
VRISGLDVTSSLAIETALPNFDVRASYGIDVAASRSQTYAALLRCNFSDSLIVRRLMKLRGYRSQIDRVSKEQTLFDNLKKSRFIEIATVPEREIVFGLIGQFWKPRGGLCTVSAEEFAEFQKEGYTKAAWNFNLISTSATTTRLSTETRVQLFGRSAKWKFRLYWFFVGPFSGFIRVAMLRQIKRQAEASSKISA